MSRRALVAGGALGLFGLVAPAAAAKKPHRHETNAATKDMPLVADPTGTPLVYPPLVDVKPGETYELAAAPATHAFLKDRPVAVIGYGGSYMGPALRLKRGETATVRVVNRLERPTNVHWHGLMVEGRWDGGTGPVLAPGESFEARLAVDQPAATLWYHAHVHGHTTRDVHDGLAGLLIVDDGTAGLLGLPQTWGVDDLPLVLQDRDFDEKGTPVLPPLSAALEHGFRGHTPIVNGIADALARVPERLVRLRLLNAAGARTFRLAFEDRRPFHLVATDGGVLDAPVELTFLPLAPGERAEILVDFSVGPANLMTEPDVHEHRMGAEVVSLPDVLSGPTRVVAFAPERDSGPAAPLPKALVPLAALPESTLGLPRRRFELRVGPAAAAATAHAHGGMTMAMPAGAVDPYTGHVTAGAADAPALTINGKSFAADRIDEKVTLGATEVWEIVCPDMAHPFHLHGAQARVLSEDGERPKLWNAGVKDTVLVENSAELLITFGRSADAATPFVFHCHLLEHEDGGMMGTFTVT
ncbi:MAG: multicopper oxidase domain-containing protein [Phyllobacteriaceae bacterium]|nr:multicopper oxidase domain-containing protein [Phyllobacteriaceae bacterium]